MSSELTNTKIPDGYHQKQVGPDQYIIPEDWPIEVLGKYIKIDTGRSFSSKKFNEIGEGVPLIRIRNLPSGETSTYYEGDFDERFLTDPETILIGMDGNFHTVQWDGPTGLLNQRVARVEANSEKLNDDFLYYCLIDEIKKIEARTPATTVKHLSQTDVKEIQTPLPPVPEQRQIADILSTVDNQIRQTDEIISKVEGLKKDTTRELFLNGVENKQSKQVQLGPKEFSIPENWNIKTITEVCDKIIDYRGKTPSYSDSGIPHIRNMNLKENELVLDDIKYVSEETYDEWMTRGFPKEGDILFSTEAPLGKAAMVPDLKFSLAQRLVALQPGKEIDGEFLMYYLTSEFIRDYYYTRATGSTVKGLSNRALQKIKVFVPSISEQSKIVSCLSQIDNKLQEEKQYKSELEDLKRGLMQDLLTGTKRVDPKQSNVR